MALSAFSETSTINSVSENSDKEVKRITLSIVPGLEREPRRYFRSRYVIGGLVVVSAFLTLLANVHISQNQYEIVTLNAQLNELSQTNNGLKEQTRYLESPQVLSAKARSVGMVEPGVPGVINLSEGTAKRGALVDGQKPEAGLLNLPVKPIKPKPVKSIPAKKLTPTAPVIQEKPVEEVKVSKKASSVESAPGVRPVFDESILNGGTIPAPSLRTPQK